MDILEILKKSREELYLDDLEFFETELATGEYDEVYASKCREQIIIIRNWMLGNDKASAEAATNSKNENKNSLVMDISQVAPKSVNPVAAAMSPKDIIFSDIKAMRENSNYKVKFKEYLKEKTEIDSEFIDSNFSFFLPWELDAIVSVIQLDEAVLEKYFGTFDKDKISRYQCFSENFFIKHFSQLDVTIVLTKGKNNWRKKENRSKQLDVFLRLKGIKL